MKTIYKLEQPADVEGRSYHTIGYFEHYKDAQAIGKTETGNQGMGHSDGHISKLTVFESEREFTSHQNTELRAQALAKLTSEEREALGLDE